MGKWNYKTIFLSLLAAWFLINIVQAVFTEVLEDEAYYFLYGKNLAWGYFDHPPMVALLVKISSLFFNGNLGVRFMTVLLQLGTLILTWKIIGIKDPKPATVILYFVIAASLVMLSAYGFITAPDVPLLFFTALFLYAYKRFLDNQNWAVVFVLSLSMAGLVYSKYQAILVIGFVVLSNLQVLKIYKFWIAGMIAVILLAPHIYWQIDHSLPSLRYHLIDRSGSFRWTWFLEYIPNQMAVFNPFTLGAVIYVMVKYKPEDIFSRALYFLIAGFIGFFWVMTIRGHVEPHWTVACSLPMLIILTRKSIESRGLKRYILTFITPSLMLILLVRISLVTDIPIIKRLGFNGKQERFEFMESKSKDLPVLFLSSFQLPSLYTYFTGKEAFPISTLYSRQTQYDIWQLEKNYHNKPVFVADSKNERSKHFEKNGLTFAGYVTDSLQTTNRILIEFERPEINIKSGKSLRLSVTINNPCGYDLDFNHKQFPVQVCAAYIKGKEVSLYPVVLSEPVNILHEGETLIRSAETVVPDLPSGTYQFGLSLNTTLGPSLNCSFVKVRINGND